MEYEKCKECPLVGQCQLVKGGNEHQCSVNRYHLGIEWGVGESKTVVTEIHFESDMKEDSFESGLV